MVAYIVRARLEFNTFQIPGAHQTRSVQPIESCDNMFRLVLLTVPRSFWKHSPQEGRVLMITQDYGSTAALVDHQERDSLGSFPALSIRNTLKAYQPKSNTGNLILQQPTTYRYLSEGEDKRSTLIQNVKQDAK